MDNPTLTEAQSALRSALAAWDRLRAEAARLYPELTPSELDRITGVALARAIRGGVKLEVLRG